ncbi:ATP-binding cassette domain-containing protein, partial [Xanthomonas citri pv. citri]
GGEQQMLAVARALVGQPQILLLDEPLEGLAPQIRDELMDTIIQMTTRTGIGCLLIEQDVDVVLGFADQVLVMENGRCLYAGTSEALRKSPEILEQTIGLGKVQ